MPPGVTSWLNRHDAKPAAGDEVVLEPRYAADLAAGMREAGLVLA